jgi:hypothetical protein
MEIVDSGLRLRRMKKGHELKKRVRTATFVIVHFLSLVDEL